MAQKLARQTGHFYPFLLEPNQDWKCGAMAATYILGKVLDHIADMIVKTNKA